MSVVPPYLKKGDTIGIVCPAGYMPADKLIKCIAALESWGYQVKLGNTPGNQFHYFAGTDEERLADLQEMLDDDNIKAVLCGRGGYGVSRIIDRVNWKRFKKNPKWIIGYSDITLLHAHVQTQLKTVSLHSPMGGAFNDAAEEDVYLQSLRVAICGGKLKYSCGGHAYNRTGKAEGQLIGGNLSLLVHMIGSASDYDTRGCILFIEDVGEYKYNVDRMMMQLKRAGKLDELAGLMVGSFSDMKDTVIPFGQETEDIIYDKVQDYDYPVCFGFPVGHVKENYALMVGAEHKLNVKEEEVKLKLL
ncbi:muramoyltetrapeptide carboxypeptidase [Filimonas lacunae]|uniref:Muramoyltetrapeptide carboxypeptidase n=1 Tax=Filimonas lacunae TaxID=477680 RepID=A0A173MMW6_9BACT|nr:LD-carboxypeptidase [Filimonas lacunae]BAV08827.1 muramoyltetrapeptide carboxypeptidase [Filimonas lacunae]SIS62382.1 muramoyltetrapeptide carboxypeptidase [Filimonas lacunae]